MSHKDIVIVSGGMDSATLLYDMVSVARDPSDVYALSFDYGQRHRRELDCAAKLCRNLSVWHRVLSLSFLADITKGSSLTDPTRDVPEGHYADETMKQTVVPGRNTIFIAAGLAYAQSLLAPDDNGVIALYYGAHGGDHAIYPDCRPKYIFAMQNVVRVASEGRVLLFAPYQNMSKGDIVVDGLKRGVDYANTWTCYKGGEIACGRCGSCCERLAAFDFAGATDPLDYADRESYKNFT